MSNASDSRALEQRLQHDYTELAAQACARSLANDPHLPVVLPDEQDNNVTARIVPNEQSTACRGELDALALRYMYHDAELHDQLAPDDALEHELFDVFERERYEAIGCNCYVGVQINLDARCHARFKSDTAKKAVVAASGVPILDESTWRVAVQTLCRCAFRRYAAPSSVNTLEYFLLKEVFGDHMQLLSDLLDDQYRFAQKLRMLLKSLSRQLVDNGDDQMSIERNIDQPQLRDTEDHVPDSVEDTVEDDTSQAANTDDTQSQVDDTQDSAEAQAQSQEGDALAEQLIDTAPDSGCDAFIVPGGEVASYKPFTTDFDEVCHAAEMADRQTLAIWREDLDKHIDQHSRLVRRLASRLQRILLSRQRRHWQFDMEEGYLDSARLSRIVTDPYVPLSFKCESEAPVRDTTITLLIDNSRSMLGRPMMLAAAATDIMARTLERCGVSVEILGFTTAHLHGGRSTDLWESQGKPENPGRLNDLRHIVYKSADTPYRSARRHLGLMLDKDLLKQNIDGEALQWAYQRLMKRSEERRILMVISDGAPVDTSTLGANSGDYLAAHLHSVIADIETGSHVELLAIGIGHDVSRFYSHALSVFDARQLGPVMLNELDSLFRKAA